MWGLCPAPAPRSIEPRLLSSLRTAASGKRSETTTPGHNRSGKALAVIQQLLSGAQRANDLFWWVTLALHGASPNKAWPLVKLSYRLVQFLGSTSMDPATTGETEVGTDRAAGKSRGMKPNNCALGGTRHLNHRVPGFSKGWTIQKRTT